MNQTTLRIFLYVKSQGKNEIGVRETQRALDLNSPSTASWHLEKLLSAGFLDKLPSNRFILNKNGKSIDKFHAPLIVSFHYMRGLIIPKFVLLIAFIIFDIIFSIILWMAIDDPLIIALNGIISLLFSFGLLIYFWITLNKQISNFDG